MGEQGVRITENLYFSPLKFESAEERKIKELSKKIEELKKTVKLPERYIINQNATILFWENGEKTVVKRANDDTFNPRLAYLTAFFQHYCGMTKNKANKFLATLEVEGELDNEEDMAKEKVRTRRKINFRRKEN